MTDADLVRQTLRLVMLDTGAPAAAKAQAARTLAEINGQLGRHQAAPLGDAKPITEMSRAQLLAEVTRG